MLLITQQDLVAAKCYDIDLAITTVENAFRLYHDHQVIFPDKVSVIFDEASQNRINCLPAGIIPYDIYGMKWVSVFPNNPQLYHKSNVSAVVLLSELKTGSPIAFMEGTMCSNLRTAATSAVAAKYLAKKETKIIGFIGSGAQAKSHLMAFLHMFPTIEVCKVASLYKVSEDEFISQMSRLYPHIQFVSCGTNYEKAARQSDIIITAISGQDKVLQGEWISKGTLYCHVGGLEDDFSVPQKADKIVCDDWGVVKHRTQTISRMYKEGLLKDEDIYANMHEIVSGEKNGRENDQEFIYFNTVGMSYTDVLLAYNMYHRVVQARLGQSINLTPENMFEIDSKFIKL